MLIPQKCSFPVVWEDSQFIKEECSLAGHLLKCVNFLGIYRPIPSSFYSILNAPCCTHLFPTFVTSSLGCDQTTYPHIIFPRHPPDPPPGQKPTSDKLSWIIPTWLIPNHNNYTSGHFLPDNLQSFRTRCTAWKEEICGGVVVFQGIRQTP